MIAETVCYLSHLRKKGKTRQARTTVNTRVRGFQALEHILKYASDIQNVMENVGANIVSLHVNIIASFLGGSTDNNCMR